ncbi:unnamed protein product [Euphydryas editha]|uniref:Uncharacterized protein n=1 Tax=Euphydryas editha TaxID=104508 RepID=A0AAU9VE29_EUPED|nr:unnamed protein product [Euphydryas editha]
MSKPVASRKLFCDILDEQNIALFQPKKDACDYCCSYKAGNVSEEDYQYHIQLKELARAEKLSDKQSAQRGLLHAVTADLQAVKLLKEYQIYDSIRPGRSAGDDCVVDLRVLKYNPNGTIEFKKHFKDDFCPLPRRPKPISAVVNNVPPLYSSRLPIFENKYQHLQQLKSVIPADCHLFYDNLPFKKK